MNNNKEDNTEEVEEKMTPEEEAQLTKDIEDTKRHAKLMRVQKGNMESRLYHRNFNRRK